MCGIVGYVGAQHAAPLLLEGLARLEYRGYDSAGLALLGRHRDQGRAAGRPGARPGRRLPKRFAGKVGIGHTRWATHGPATDVNAAPARRRPRTSRWSTTASSTTPQAAAAAGRRESSSPATPTPRCIAHLIARPRRRPSKREVGRRRSPDRGHVRPRRAGRGPPDRIVLARSGSPADRRRRRAARCSSRATCRDRAHTSSVVHLDDGELATITADRLPTSARPTATAPTPIDRRRRPPDATSAATTSTSCTRRSSSSRPRPSGVLRGRLDERFGTARLDGLNLDAARAPGDPAGQDPRLRHRPTTSVRWAQT